MIYEILLILKKMLISAKAVRGIMYFACFLKFFKHSYEVSRYEVPSFFIVGHMQQILGSMSGAEDYQIVFSSMLNLAKGHSE